jgi:HEAT repeat protein
MIAPFIAALLVSGTPSSPAERPDPVGIVSADAAQETEQTLYNNAIAARDKSDWELAAETFAKVASMKGEHAAAALFWRGDALYKLSRNDEALKSLAAVKAGYPNSRWVRDAEARILQIRQASGQTPQVDESANEDLKLMALSGLMNADPEKALPLIRQLLAGSGSPKMRERAMFVLAQSGRPEARQVLVDAAKSSANPELQTQAIRNLGLFGGQEARQTLAEIYSTSQSVEARKAVLQAFMLGGDRGRLLDAARKETSPELRREAIQQLGVSGAREELWQLYQQEKDVQVRRAIINSLFICGGADRLGELATKETDPELRREAIEKLGLTGQGSAATLKNIYATDKDPDIRRTVLNAFFIQGNAKALIEIAKQETDPAMKREAVQKLSIMGSKEASEYMMELLK